VNNRRTVGVVDYGVGNHNSVWRAMHALGYRCRVSHDSDVLDTADIVLLPGVGAFPPAMEAIESRGLDEYLRARARAGKPCLGICLGMQLMADSSSEFGLTAGLGLIPGQVVPLRQARWHIGWNTFESTGPDSLLRPIDGRSVYFNHSFVFEAPPEYTIGVSRLERPFVVAIRRENVVGLQFHPEKSQAVGHESLRRVIDGLCDA
jgi:glutamine amidotransferase